MKIAPFLTLLGMPREPNSAQIVAENLRRLMRHYGISQAELGRRANVAQTMISGLLREDDGPKNPTIGTLDKLAAELRVASWQLMIPNVELGLLLDGDLGRVIESYARVPPEGRAIVLRVAETEARYANPAAAPHGETPRK